jgi:hypothetical protein
METVLHPAALSDLADYLNYLLQAKVGDETRLAFSNAIKQTRQKIERNPRTWSFAEGSKRVRKVQIPRFKMQVFYLIRADGAPLILEFAGAGRLPRWADRLS